MEFSTKFSFSFDSFKRRRTVRIHYLTLFNVHSDGISWDEMYCTNCDNDSGNETATRAGTVY